MTTIDREGEVDLRSGKVAVIGYGSQGYAARLHPHRLGLSRSIASATGARRGRWPKRTPSPSARAMWPNAKPAQVVAFVLPDQVQPGGAPSRRLSRASSRTRPSCSPTASTSITDGSPRPPATTRAMVAPKGPGHIVRRLFAEAFWMPAIVAVAQDASGRAFDLALAYGAAIGAGRAGMIETTFAEETETDLFGEQAVLCGGVTELIRLRLRDARRSRLPARGRVLRVPARAELIVDLIWEGGLSGMRYSVSDTAEFGDLTRPARDRRPRPRERCGAPRRHPVGRLRAVSGSPRWMPASLTWTSCAPRPPTSDRTGRQGAAALMRASPRRRRLATLTVGVGLLGYGTVGSAVNRLLVENADDIERATGHRLPRRSGARPRSRRGAPSPPSRAS